MSFAHKPEHARDYSLCRNFGLRAPERCQRWPTGFHSMLLLKPCSVLADTFVGLPTSFLVRIDHRTFRVCLPSLIWETVVLRVENHVWPA